MDLVKMISSEKKQLLKLISDGIHVLMSVTCQSDEIGARQDIDDNDDDDDFEKSEKYIKKNLLTWENSAIGLKRYWFSVIKFDNMVEEADYDTVARILIYLDEIDFNIKSVFEESCIYECDMNEVEQMYANAIENNEITSFEQLLNY
jgi:hypothetical protein